MSTKSTLAYGEGFHFYQELLDNSFDVHLELTNNPEYSASNGNVSITIPADIWEAIRHISLCKFEYADLSDDQLLALAEKEVDKRIDEYNKANDNLKEWISLSGSLIFGRANSSREDQIHFALKHYKDKRQEELYIRNKANSYKTYDG